jgi:hypothetical protein
MQAEIISLCQTSELEVSFKSERIDLSYEITISSAATISLNPQTETNNCIATYQNLKANDKVIIFSHDDSF